MHGYVHNDNGYDRPRSHQYTPVSKYIASAVKIEVGLPMWDKEHNNGRDPVNRENGSSQNMVQLGQEDAPPAQIIGVLESTSPYMLDVMNKHVQRAYNWVDGVNSHIEGWMSRYNTDSPESLLLDKLSAQEDETELSPSEERDGGTVIGNLRQLGAFSE